jgi:hypothetical protein
MFARSRSERRYEIARCVRPSRRKIRGDSQARQRLQPPLIVETLARLRSRSRSTGRQQFYTHLFLHFRRYANARRELHENRSAEIDDQDVRETISDPRLF